MISLHNHVQIKTNSALFARATHLGHGAWSDNDKRRIAAYPDSPDASRIKPGAYIDLVRLHGRTLDFDIRIRSSNFSGMLRTVGDAQRFDRRGGLFIRLDRGSGNKSNFMLDTYRSHIIPPRRHELRDEQTEFDSFPVIECRGEFCESFDIKEIERLTHPCYEHDICSSLNYFVCGGEKEADELAMYLKIMIKAKNR